MAANVMTVEFGTIHHFSIVWKKILKAVCAVL